MNEASDFPAFLPLLNCPCHPMPQPQQPFEDQLKPPPLPRSLPWSPPETITPSSMASPDLPGSATQCPLGPKVWACAHCRTQFWASTCLRYTQLPDTQSFPFGEKGEAGGSVWKRTGLGLGVNVSAFWEKSTHHPEWAHLTEDRVLGSLTGS